MDLFTSLALRSLGGANAVPPLRPALFAAEMPRNAPEGIEEAETPRAPSVLRKETQPGPQAPLRTQAAEEEAAPASQTRPSEPASLHSSATILAHAHLPRADEAPTPHPASVVQAPLFPAPRRQDEPDSTTPGDTVPPIRESVHEFHTRELVLQPPASEPQPTGTRETLRETVREVMREDARLPQPALLVPPARTPNPALLIPTAATPRPAALSAPAAPPSQAPVVQVTIGRVDVTAAPQPQPGRAPAKPVEQRPVISLGDYLRNPRGRLQ